MIKIILIAVIFIFAGCNTPQEILYLVNDNNGQEVEVSLKEEIEISLDANPTTGYTWSISEIDTNFTKQISEVQYKANSNLIGSPGKQTFRFQTIASGKTALKLIYHRPWEKEVIPSDTFFIKINVI